MMLHIAHRSGWEKAQEDGIYSAATRGANIEEVGFIRLITRTTPSGR